MLEDDNAQPLFLDKPQCEEYANQKMNILNV